MIVVIKKKLLQYPCPLCSCLGHIKQECLDRCKICKDAHHWKRCPKRPKTCKICYTEGHKTNEPCVQKNKVKCAVCSRFHNLKFCPSVCKKCDIKKTGIHFKNQCPHKFYIKFIPVEMRPGFCNKCNHYSPDLIPIVEISGNVLEQDLCDTCWHKLEIEVGRKITI